MNNPTPEDLRKADLPTPVITPNREETLVRVEMLYEKLDMFGYNDEVARSIVHALGRALGKRP